MFLGIFGNNQFRIRRNRQNLHQIIPKKQNSIKQKSPFTGFLFLLFIDLGIIGPAKDIIYAHVIKLGKNNEGFGGRDALPVLEFGQQRLFDTRLHLQRHLRKLFILS